MEVDAQIDAAPDGFAPLANATGGEHLNGPFHIRKGPEGAVLGFRCKARHLNAAGSCHGGLPAVFADMLGYGIAVGDHSGAAPTITPGVDFLAPIRDGDRVEAHVEPPKKSPAAPARRPSFRRRYAPKASRARAATVSTRSETPAPAPRS